MLLSMPHLSIYSQTAGICTCWALLHLTTLGYRSHLVQTEHIHIHTAVIEYYFNDFLGKQTALVTRLAVQIIEVLPVFTSGIYFFNEFLCCRSPVVTSVWVC